MNFPLSSPRRLRWALRLRHPVVALALPAVIAVVGWLALPAVGRRWRPPGLSLPDVPRLRLAVPRFGPRVSTPAPVPTSAAPTALAVAPPSVPGPASVSPVAGPAHTTLACRVVRSGAAEGDGSEWGVEVTLEDGGRNGRGEMLLPAGTSASGRVRLDRAGGPTAWPSTWRLWLPEGDGTGRDLELSASFLPVAGGISPGATGQLVVRRWSRIGERRGDLATAAVATPVHAEEPAVQTLTGRGAGRTGRDYFELPRP